MQYSLNLMDQIHSNFNLNKNGILSLKMTFLIP